MSKDDRYHDQAKSDYLKIPSDKPRQQDTIGHSFRKEFATTKFMTGHPNYKKWIRADVENHINSYRDIEGSEIRLIRGQEWPLKLESLLFLVGLIVNKPCISNWEIRQSDLFSPLPVPL